MDVLNAEWVAASLKHNAITVAVMVVEFTGNEWQALDEDTQAEFLAFGEKVVSKLGARIGVDVV